MNSISSIKKFCMSLLISLFISSNPSISVSATEFANFAEVTAAFVTMGMDMAANHYALQKNSSQDALMLKCVTDALSLSTKGLYFYNNITAKTRFGNNAHWNWTERDCVTHGALAALNIKDLALHIYELTQQKKPVIVDVSVGEENEEDALGRNLNYFRRVILQPILKGLTAAAVGCTQNYATSYSGDRARYTASAAHSFANLLEQYSNLTPGSKLEEVAILALILNGLWLGHEGKEYAAHLRNVRGATQHGACPSCSEETELNILGCAHSYCKACLRNAVNAHDHANLNGMFCPHEECERHLSRNEIENITGNSPDAMLHYDTAAHNNPNPNPVRPEPDIVDLPTRQGVCGICFMEEEVQVLECNHTYCNECIKGFVRNRFTDHRPQLNATQCPHVEGARGNVRCAHYLTRNEIGAIMIDPEEPGANEILRAAVLQAYDQNKAAQRNGRMVPDNEFARLALIERRKAAGEARIHIRGANGRFCGAVIERIAGCNTMHCPMCATEFCWICQSVQERHIHPAHPNCPVVRGGAGWGDPFAADDLPAAG
jgi:hypothetical protein